MTYGTVKFWALVTENTDGKIDEQRFHTWEDATIAFRETVKTDLSSAAVYAVQTNGRRIETWKTVAK